MTTEKELRKQISGSVVDFSTRTATEDRMELICEEVLLQKSISTDWDGHFQHEKQDFLTA